MENRIATEQNVYDIGGVGVPTPSKLYTIYRLSSFGCNTKNTYSNDKRLVILTDVFAYIDMLLSKSGTTHNVQSTIHSYYKNTVEFTIVSTNSNINVPQISLDIQLVDSKYNILTTYTDSGKVKNYTNQYFNIDGGTTFSIKLQNTDLLSNVEPCIVEIKVADMLGNYYDCDDKYKSIGWKIVYDNDNGGGSLIT